MVSHGKNTGSCRRHQETLTTHGARVLTSDTDSSPCREAAEVKSCFDAMGAAAAAGATLRGHLEVERASDKILSLSRAGKYPALPSTNVLRRDIVIVVAVLGVGRETNRTWGPGCPALEITLMCAGVTRDRMLTYVHSLSHFRSHLAINAVHFKCCAVCSQHKFVSRPIT